MKYVYLIDYIPVDTDGYQRFSKQQPILNDPSLYQVIVAPDDNVLHAGYQRRKNRPDLDKKSKVERSQLDYNVECAYNCAVIHPEENASITGNRYAVRLSLYAITDERYQNFNDAKSVDAPITSVRKLRRTRSKFMLHDVFRDHDAEFPDTPQKKQKLMQCVDSEYLPRCYSMVHTSLDNLKSPGDTTGPTLIATLCFSDEGTGHYLVLPESKFEEWSDEETAQKLFVNAVKKIRCKNASLSNIPTIDPAQAIIAEETSDEENDQENVKKSSGSSSIWDKWFCCFGLLGKGKKERTWTYGGGSEETELLERHEGCGK